MVDDSGDATLALVAHNLRGAIGVAAGAARTVRLRWEHLDEARRVELLELAERGMARVDDAVFGIARGLPAEVIADLQKEFERDAAPRRDRSATLPFPVPEDEDGRLQALHRYGVLDQPAAPDLDAVVRIASHLTGTPHAVINLIDADRQWQAAAFGVERSEVPREQSMCAGAVTHRNTVHVADSSTDPRFASNPFVTGERGRIRLYAAAPLVAPVHHVVGTICVFDEAPGSLSAAQIARLEDLATLVTSLFEARALAAELRAAAQWQHELIADLDRERRRNDHLLERLAREGPDPT